MFRNSSDYSISQYTGQQIPVNFWRDFYLRLDKFNRSGTDLSISFSVIEIAKSIEFNNQDFVNVAVYLDKRLVYGNNYKCRNQYGNEWCLVKLKDLPEYSELRMQITLVIDGQEYSPITYTL